MAMLRIDTHYSTESTNFSVAGKVVGPWGNLEEVTFIDAAGRELLTRMFRQGVALVATGVLIEAIVEEIKLTWVRSTWLRRIQTP
jgi:hypothetical protein